MILSEFAKTLYPFCGNGENPSNFLVALFSGITDDKYGDDETKSLLEKSSDYLKRIYNGAKSITAKQASHVLTHLDKANFDVYLYDLLSEDSLIELCGALDPYIGNSTKDDVTQKCADLFVSVLQEIAKEKTVTSLVPVTASSSVISLSADCADSLLLAEVSMCCPKCGKRLMRKTGGSAVGDYAIVEIYPSCPSPSQNAMLTIVPAPAYFLDAVQNKTVLCHSCYNDYVNAFSLVAYSELLKLKTDVVALYEAAASIDNLNVEHSLTEIVNELAAVSESDLADSLSFIPLKIDKKIPPSTFNLKRKIEAAVTTYYPHIEQLFVQVSKKNSVNFDRIAKAVKYACDELLDRGLSQTQVFTQMVQWLKSKTNSKDDVTCEIMVSFFVQNCEVFHEIAE